MSSTPFLRLILLDRDDPIIPYAGLDLDERETQVLTLLLARLGHQQIRPLAGDDV